MVLNSLVKVSKNEVITFERLKISLKSFMGPVGHELWAWAKGQGNHFG
jgi:hypothetical protein